MRIPLEWTGSDMSQSQRTNWIPRPPEATRACIDIGWTAVNSPKGTLGIEVANHRKPGVPGEEYEIDIKVHPNETSGKTIIDGIVTSADGIAMVYTRQSGGAGDVFTDSTCVVGTFPTITWTL